MKKLVIDYKRHWGESGACYNQTITLTSDFIKYINKLIRYYHNASDEVKATICESVGFSSYYDFYLEELPQNENVIYLGLTQLKFVYYHLAMNNYDVSKIKARNTILKIKEV